MSALLFYKLNNDEVFTFYDLKKNNKELFKKKFHGYAKKYTLDEGFIDDTSKVLYDINEIYMKYTRTVL